MFWHCVMWHDYFTLGITSMSILMCQLLFIKTNARIVFITHRLPPLCMANRKWIWSPQDWLPIDFCRHKIGNWEISNAIMKVLEIQSPILWQSNILVIIHVVIESFSLPILWPPKTFHSLIQFMVFCNWIF
jgi:hypothetical protein